MQPVAGLRSSAKSAWFVCLREDGQKGIVVYGYGAYTSYMYPGGLDLQRISPPIIR